MNIVDRGSESCVFVGRDGEKGVKGVVEIVQLDVVAVEAFDVEQGAVKEFELLSWVLCSLRQAYIID